MPGSWGSNSQSNNYSFSERPVVDFGCFTIDVAESDGQRIPSMPGFDESATSQPQRCVSALKAQMCAWALISMMRILEADDTAGKINAAEGKA